MRRTRHRFTAFLTSSNIGLNLFKSSQLHSLSSLSSQQHVKRSFLLSQSSRSRSHSIYMSVPFSDPSDNEKNNEDDENHDFSPDDSDAEIDMQVLRNRITNLNETKDSMSDIKISVPDLANGTDFFISEDGEDDVAEIESVEGKLGEIGTVWVIVFTNVKDGSEGVYSLSISDQNVVLAFQEKEEAYRYSMSLEVQDFPSPQVCAFEADELGEICKESGFQFGFVPRGALVTPPEESAIDDLDKWRGKSKNTGDHDKLGMSPEDVEMMKKRLDSLFGK